MSPSFRQVGLNAVLDQNPEKPSPCCIVCGTWVCRECWSFRRPYARYDEPAHHICGGCGGIDGFFLATRHTHWKANKPFFVNGYRHRVPPKTPFEVPKMNPWACPAGDPCPGTGCHACCPSYDPCGKSECKTCHVDDPVHHNQLVARGLIHHKWNEDEVHVPEEADTMTDLEECDWVVRMATPETPDEYCGLEVPRGNEFCPRHQKKTDNMARWEARAAEKEKFLGDNRPMPAKPCADREPHPSHLWHYKADGETRWCIGLSSPEEPSKLQQTLSEIGQAVSEYPHDDGDVIVLGPEIFLDKETQVISWKGKNYAPVEVPEPLTEVKRDISADCRYARQSAAEWAVSLIRPTVTPDTLVSNTANTTVQLAQRLYDWLIQE